MATHDDPDLSPEDYKLLKHLDETVIRNQESAAERRLAEGLIDHGVVVKDDAGHLRITIKGRRLLRARNG